MHEQAIIQAQLAKESSMLSPRAVRLREVDLQKAARGEGSHDPKRPILFREFLEGLVRIAHAKYPDGGALSKRVHKLLKLLKAGAMKEDSDQFRKWLVAPAVMHEVNRNGPLLRSVFLSYAVMVSASECGL